MNAFPRPRQITSQRATKTVAPKADQESGSAKATKKTAARKRAAKSKTRSAIENMTVRRHAALLVALPFNLDGIYRS